MMACGDKIQRGHQMYKEGKHTEALTFYTEALAMAKTKAQKIALHSNRAACYLKLNDFKEAAEECTSVLELDRKHTGALMLRAQTLVTMKEYHSALFDVNRLIELQPSCDAYRDLEARLKTQLSLAPIPESEEELVLAESEEEQAEEVVNSRLTSTSNIKVDQTAESTTSMPQEDTKAANPLSDSKGWEAIPKPKGHSGLDYSRWDCVQDDSSDEDDDDNESQPQYRFRVRTVGVKPVR